MSSLIFEKEMELCDFCNSQCQKIEREHPFYFLDFTKWGKRWNYYINIWSRTIKEADFWLTLSH